MISNTKKKIDKFSFSNCFSIFELKLSIWMGQAHHPRLPQTLTGGWVGWGYVTCTAYRSQKEVDITETVVNLKELFSSIAAILVLMYPDQTKSTRKCFKLLCCRYLWYKREPVSYLFLKMIVCEKTSNYIEGNGLLVVSIGYSAQHYSFLLCTLVVYSNCIPPWIQWKG